MTEHEKFVASLKLPLALYPQWGVWVVQKHEPIVIVTDIYGNEMEEISDIPEWVTDEESFEKFVEECHPKYWDGDADPGQYEED